MLRVTRMTNNTERYINTWVGVKENEEHFFYWNYNDTIKSCDFSHNTLYIHSVVIVG